MTTDPSGGSIPVFNTVSWSDTAKANVSWDAVSWSDVSWSDVSYEDAAEGDAAGDTADSFADPTDLAAAAADPDLQLPADLVAPTSTSTTPVTSTLP